MYQEAPLITMYARILDNLTGEELLSFTDVKDNKTWYYGKCNSLEGGESQYIIEFDIWNNELSFNAGTYDTRCKDALNCKFELNIDANSELAKIQPSFMYARCLTNGFEEFIPIKNNNKLNISGNVCPNSNILKGNGDHAIVQTKIVLPEGSNIKIDRYSFNFKLCYDYD